jgi:hypothetical protein
LVCNLLGDADRPITVFVEVIRERYQETGIGDPLHGLENPLQWKRFLGPRTNPANRINERFAVAALAFSSCSRIR